MNGHFALPVKTSPSRQLFLDLDLDLFASKCYELCVRKLSNVHFVYISLSITSLNSILFNPVKTLRPSKTSTFLYCFTFVPFLSACSANGV